jgi:hypothetical protein
MRAVGYIVLTVAASVSLVFVNVLKPTSFGAAAFLSTWLILPYAALALTLMFSAKERASKVANVIVAVLVAGGGLLFLSDVIFLRLDPQGGIAVLFTPIYQAFGIAVLLPTCQWLLGKVST